MNLILYNNRIKATRTHLMQMSSGIENTIYLSIYKSDYISVHDPSELEKDDMERTHIMDINNGLGNTTYRFQIPNIEGIINFSI